MSYCIFIVLSLKQFVFLSSYIHSFCRFQHCTRLWRSTGLLLAVGPLQLVIMEKDHFGLMRWFSSLFVEIIDKEFKTIQRTNMCFLHYFYTDPGDIFFQWGNLSYPYFIFSLHISGKITDALSKIFDWNEYQDSLLTRRMYKIESTLLLTSSNW